MVNPTCMDKQQGARFFLIFLLCSLLLLLKLFWTFLSAIILAMLIVSVFYPVYARVKAMLRNREVLASLCVTFFILIILIIPVSWFISTLSNEAYEFYKKSSNQVSLTKIKKIVKDDPVWGERF